MNQPAHVLLIGNNPETRQEQIDVLRHFWIIAAAGSSCFEEFLPSSQVAVLCHSLTDTEREDAVRIIHRAPTQITVVKMNGYDSGPHAGMDASVDLTHGPGSLVSTIYQLLVERGIPSRRWPTMEIPVLSGVH